LLPRIEVLEGEGSHNQIEAGQNCAWAVRATLAQRQGRPEARTILARLDSAQRSKSIGDPLALLYIAQLQEQLGDTVAALRTVRHRPYHWNTIWLLSAFLRQEGRLAARNGDRVGAIRAYQHYLRLRAHPEPRLQPQVRQVREELARLVGEP
jgi:hypothetical protein